MSLLGVDIGTSGLKAGAYNVDTGRVVASARVDYSPIISAQGAVEQDPETIWRAFVQASQSIATSPGVMHDPVSALACSVSGDEVVLVDEDLEPIAPVVLSADARGRTFLDGLLRSLPTQRIHDLTGCTPDVGFPLIRLGWTRQHDPRGFQRVRHVLGWGEFVMARLGVEPVSDLSSASRWLALDLDRGYWSEEILSAAGMDPSIFPEVAASGVEVGSIGSAASRTTGLPVGAVVVTGGYDQACAALGAGATDREDAAIGSGSWEVLTVLASASDGPHVATTTLQTGFAPMSELRCVYGLNASGTSLLTWYQGWLGDDQRPIGELLAGLSSGPSRLLVIPHLQGSATAFQGTPATGAVIGLDLGTSRNDLLLGIIEGMTFELRANLDLVRQAGLNPKRARNVGGGSRSDTWAQIKADVLGIPIETTNVDEGGSLAAAVLAGVATGRYSDVTGPIDRFVRPISTFEPSASLAHAYVDRYETYRSTVIGLARVNAGLRISGKAAGQSDSLN